MGEYKYYINYSFTRLMFGLEYEKNYSLQIHILWFTFGIGLDWCASGFGIWKI